MNPDDLIEGGLIRDSDLDGGPPVPGGGPLEPIGRYELLEEVGRGGAGVVYRALDPLLNREVALKVLRFGDFDLESRFLRESELLALLSHPGIMPIFDFGREGSAFYYTMPMASGLSFDGWVAKRKPDFKEIARIIRQAGEALDHAHSRGVLHRDVKSSNILITEEANALLADFGLGRIQEPPGAAEPRMTQSGQVMGTPGYMAPEFASGDLKGVDVRCDVYGLGATLYEAMTGRPPFVGKSSLEILKKVVSSEPPPPRKLAPNVPVDLEIICLKAIERDPRRRYATAREFADDLGRYLAGEPIMARRASLTYRVTRYVARRRALVAVSMAGVLAVAGIGLYSAMRAEESGARRRRVTDILEKASRHAGAMNDLLRTRGDADPDVEAQAMLALAEIGKAIAVEPENPDAHFQKGRVHSLRFERDEARRSYEIAIKKGPVARALLERALLDCQDLVVLRAAGTNASESRIEALKAGIRRDLETFIALKSDPEELEFGQALLDLATLETRGYREAARKLAAYAVQSRDWRAFYWKGIAEIESGQFERALESLETALDSRRNSRNSALILDRLGVVYICLDRLEDAEKRLQRAVELNPALVGPKVNLASVYFELGNFDEAIQWSGDAVKLDGGSIVAHALRGQACVMKHMELTKGGDSEGGRALLRDAKASLEVARPAYPADSEQGKELLRAWEYVRQKTSY